METDPIRDALEAATCALCREAKSCRDDCGGKCAWREGDVNMPACAAAAVAAFLRHYSKRSPTALIYGPAVADDVERAAKEAA